MNQQPESFTEAIARAKATAEHADEVIRGLVDRMSLAVEEATDGQVYAMVTDAMDGDWNIWLGKSGIVNDVVNLIQITLDYDLLTFKQSSYDYVQVKFPSDEEDLSIRAAFVKMLSRPVVWRLIARLRGEDK